MSDYLNPIKDDNKFIDQSPFRSKRNTEGDWCLFFNHEEVAELMGHEVKFYPNGVLLVLKDYAKDFSKKQNPNIKIESKSFVFYNNEPVDKIEDKQPILEIHNRNRDKVTREPKEPIKDIEVKVFEHFLCVKETDTIANSTSEYHIDILTGKKTFDLNEDNQIGFDI